MTTSYQAPRPMFHAEGITSAIIVVGVERFAGIEVVVVPCRSTDQFMALPPAIRYNDRVLGKTGWNSDRGIAYFRSDAALAWPA